MTFLFYLSNFPTLANTVAGRVTKLKNLSDVYSILLGAIENEVQLFIQKENFKTFRGKTALIGQVDFREFAKMYFGIKREAEQ